MVVDNTTVAIHVHRVNFMGGITPSFLLGGRGYVWGVGAEGCGAGGGGG
jgi:hypothetical protein